MPGCSLSGFILAGGGLFGGNVFKKNSYTFDQYKQNRVWSRKKGRSNHSSNLVHCIICWYNSTLFKDAIYKKHNSTSWGHGKPYSVSLNDTLSNDTKLINPQGILAFSYSFSSGVTFVNKVETQVACEQALHDACLRVLSRLARAFARPNRWAWTSATNLSQHVDIDASSS